MQRENQFYENTELGGCEGAEHSRVQLFRQRFKGRACRVEQTHWCPFRSHLSLQAAVKRRCRSLPSPIGSYTHCCRLIEMRTPVASALTALPGLALHQLYVCFLLQGPTVVLKMRLIQGWASPLPGIVPATHRGANTC